MKGVVIGVGDIGKNVVKFEVVGFCWVFGVGNFEGRIYGGVVVGDDYVG